MSFIQSDRAPQAAAPRREARVPQSTAFSQGDFEAALRQASERASAHQSDDEQSVKDERDPERTPEGAAAGALAGRGQGAGGELAAQDAKTADTGGPGLGPVAGRTGGAEPTVAQTAAGQIDQAAFAAAMESAARGATPADASAKVTLAFNDPFAPLTAMAVTRAPDGALTLALSAQPHALNQVNRSLETLRQRLNDRGLPVGDIGVSDETADAETAALLVRRRL